MLMEEEAFSPTDADVHARAFQDMKVKSSQA
jgi:hypothetical protein